MATRRSSDSRSDNPEAMRASPPEPRNGTESPREPEARTTPRRSASSRRAKGKEKPKSQAAAPGGVAEPQAEAQWHERPQGAPQQDEDSGDAAAGLHAGASAATPPEGFERQSPQQMAAGAHSPEGMEEAGMDAGQRSRGEGGAGAPGREQHPRISPEERHQMIAQRAYARAERRGFHPGFEVQDWLEAEREVDALLDADENGSRQ